MTKRVEHSQDAKSPREYMQDQVVGKVVHVINTDRYYVDGEMIGSGVGPVFSSQEKAHGYLIEQGFRENGPWSYEKTDDKYRSFAYIFTQEVQ